MIPAWALALSLLLAPQVTAGDRVRIDVEAVRRGVDARLGEAADPWAITIAPAEGGVRVQARAPGRALVDQTVELPEDGSDAERAMIVASTLALALEQAPRVEVPDAEPSAEAVDPAIFIPPWWLSIQGHAALGLGPLDPAGGVALDAGRWLGTGRHVRASLAVGWAHGRKDPLGVHAVEPIVQVDAGKALCSRTWMGAGVGVGATGAWAFDRERASGWALRVHVPAIIEVVLVEPLFFRGSAGLDVRTPSLNFIGVQGSTRWGVLRPFAAIGFGVRLGKRS